MEIGLPVDFAIKSPPILKSGAYLMQGLAPRLGNPLLNEQQ